MIGINGRDGEDGNGVQTNQETVRMIVIDKTLVLKMIAFDKERDRQNDSDV